MDSSNFRGKKIILLLAVLVYISMSNAAFFDGCDHIYQLSAGTSYLKSPYYPNTYPSGSSCRYKFVAPQDHQITVNCTIDMPRNGNKCSTERFYIARDGDILLNGSEEVCGFGVIVRTSLFRSLTLAYTSQGSTGRFQCLFDVQPRPCDCGWTVNSKIMNGMNANVNEYPSMAALKNVINGKYFCGATIITHRILLTAAHCTRLVFLSLINLRAVVGAHDLSKSGSGDTRFIAEHSILTFKEHEHYNPDTNENDIALLWTLTDIEWSRGVGPICLPPISQSFNTFANSFVDVIGWGTTSFAGPPSNILQKITLLVLENSSCQQVYTNIANITASQLCTYDYTGSSKDSCQYDSGGPVILRKARMFLVGCISFGQVCGQGGYSTGVNTRVTSYLSWINQYANHGTCSPSLE